MNEQGITRGVIKATWIEFVTSARTLRSSDAVPATTHSKEGERKKTASVAVPYCVRNRDWATTRPSGQCLRLDEESLTALGLGEIQRLTEDEFNALLLTSRR
jgi:hypothetical protein